MAGWIKLHRKIRDHWIYQEDRVFSRYEAWLDLIMMANHKQTKVLLGNELVEAQRGQVITSESKLMKKWNWGKSRLRAFLEILENDNMIIKKSDRKKTIITIENYCTYHDYDQDDEPPSDHEQTDSRLISDTMKNVKNDKNNNTTTITTGQNDVVKFYEQNVTPFVSPVVQEKIIDWVNELGEDIVKYSFEIMATANVKDFRFANKILNDWYMDGVRTLEQAKEAQRQFQDRRQSKQTNVTHFPKKTSKPKLESFKPTGTTGGLSDDEYKKAMELARMLDES